MFGMFNQTQGQKETKNNFSKKSFFELLKGIVIDQNSSKRTEKFRSC